MFHRYLSGARHSFAVVALVCAQVPSYLDEVIGPAYNVLAEQLANIGHGVIDHSSVRNYDDFNEIFWQEDCLKMTVATMFDGKTFKRK